MLKEILDLENSCHVRLEHMTEVPIQRKYSKYFILFNLRRLYIYQLLLLDVKLPGRKQFDKLKMLRKTDRCCVCKRGYLKAQLVHCNFCTRLYHLNCLDPPIRDWDHSTRWICPAHNKFYVRIFFPQ